MSKSPTKTNTTANGKGKLEDKLDPKVSVSVLFCPAPVSRLPLHASIPISLQHQVQIKSVLY